MPTRTSRQLALQTLIDKNACREQIYLFRAKFGESVEITIDLCRAVAGDFNWSWAAQFLLSKPLWDQYYAASKPLWDQYYAARKSLWDQYDAACKSLLDQYDAACMSLWDQYDVARKSLWDQYNAACAALFAELYIKDGVNG